MGGSGGGSAGTVDYPEYMKNAHEHWILELRNLITAYHLMGSTPYSTMGVYDPVWEYTGITNAADYPLHKGTQYSMLAMNAFDRLYILNLEQTQKQLTALDAYVVGCSASMSGLAGWEAPLSEIRSSVQTILSAFNTALGLLDTSITNLRLVGTATAWATAVAAIQTDVETYLNMISLSDATTTFSGVVPAAISLTLYSPETVSIADVIPDVVTFSGTTPSGLVLSDPDNASLTFTHSPVPISIPVIDVYEHPIELETVEFVAPIAADIDLAARIAAFNAEVDHEIETTHLPRFERGMQTINAVISSDYIIGKGIIEAAAGRQKETFSTELNVKAYTQKQELDHRGELHAQDINTRIHQQHQELTAQVGMQGRDLDVRAQMQERELGVGVASQARDFAFRRDEAIFTGEVNLRELDSREQQQRRQLSGEGQMQAREIVHKNQSLGLQAQMQTQNLGFQSKLQRQQLMAQEGMQKRELIGSSHNTNQQLGAQTGMQSRELLFRAKEKELEAARFNEEIDVQRAQVRAGLIGATLPSVSGRYTSLLQVRLGAEEAAAKVAKDKLDGILARTAVELDKLRIIDSATNIYSTMFSGYDVLHENIKMNAISMQTYTAGETSLVNILKESTSILNTAASLFIEAMRMRSVLIKESNDTAMRVHEADARWKLDIYSSGANVLASISGAAVPTSGQKTSPVASALGGALSGAATGAMITPGAPMIGGGIGAAIGLGIGLFS